MCEKTDGTRYLMVIVKGAPYLVRSDPGLLVCIHLIAIVPTAQVDRRFDFFNVMVFLPRHPLRPEEPRDVRRSGAASQNEAPPHPPSRPLHPRFRCGTTGRSWTASWCWTRWCVVGFDVVLLVSDARLHPQNGKKELVYLIYDAVTVNGVSVRGHVTPALVRS